MNAKLSYARATAQSATVAQTRNPSDAWEQSWQAHWSTAGLPGYELPSQFSDARGTREREFLTQSLTTEKERVRLKRINDEFEPAFRGLPR